MMAVSTTSAKRRTNLTWLLRWPASTKPAASRRRSISRKDCGLSRPNLNLDCANLRWPGCPRRLKVQFNCLLEVRQSFFLGLSLTRDIELQALRDVPVSLTPDSSRERSLHVLIVSQTNIGHPRAFRTHRRAHSGSRCRHSIRRRRCPTGGSLPQKLNRMANCICRGEPSTLVSFPKLLVEVRLRFAPSGSKRTVLVAL